MGIRLGFAAVKTYVNPLAKFFFAAIVINLLFFPNILAAPTNQWIKQGSGAWHEEAWSLGILPDDGQEVAISNPGAKTVEINHGTVQAAPSSLTIQSLFVSGENTLLLNAQNTPLRITSPSNVWNGLSLSNGGTLVNASMDVQIGHTNRSVLILQGGRLLQLGGSVRARTTYIVGGQYHLTNGVFETDFLDFPYGGLFAQYGGVAHLGATRLLYSTNILIDGQMYAHSGLSVSDYSHFLQSGGTNHVSGLSVGPHSAGGGRYDLTGGLLTTSNTFVGAFMSSSEMRQSGGVHVITNALRLQGSSRYYPPQHSPGRYHLSAGTFSAAQVEMDSTFGRAEFIQSGGAASVGGSIQFNPPVARPLDYNRGLLKLEGGTLTTDSISYSAAGADITQTAGALIVSNLFSFGGFIPPPYDYGSQTRRIARYDFSGGTFSANHIELHGEWIIGSSSIARRISNPGSVTMAGTLRLGDVNEQLGRFILSSNAVIDFAPGHGKLAFFNSSSENWHPNATLVVSNWSGSFSGNGDDQLRFGQDESGLTQAQLNQIRFINPAGLPPGEYPAVILETGELIPPAPLAASIILSYNAATTTLSWPPSYQLQTSINADGPYEDIRDRNPPYTLNFTDGPQRFFRLRLRD